MFNDLPEGQTHSWNDGCGAPEHNDTCPHCGGELKVGTGYAEMEIVAHDCRAELERKAVEGVKKALEEFPNVFKRLKGE